MKQKNKKSWKLMAVDYAAPLVHPVSYMAACASHKLSRIIGIDGTEPVLFEVREEGVGKQKFRWCYVKDGKSGFINCGKATLDKLEKSSKFFEKINKESRITIKKVEDYVSHLFGQNLEQYSNKKLGDVYLKLFNLMIDMNIWGHIVNLVDFSHNMLTNKIWSFLEKLTKEKNYRLSAPEVFGTLTTPIEKNPLQKYEEDFYKLLSQIQRGEKSIDEAASKLKEEYDWFEFHYSGPTILDKKYFINLLASEIKQGTEGRKKLSEFKEKEEALAKNQEKISKELDLSKKELYWINIAKTFMFLKALRKDIIFEMSRFSDPLIREIGKRLNLAPLQVRYLTVSEIINTLSGRKIDMELINKRIKYSVWWVGREKIKVFIGKEAEEYSRRIIEEEVPEDVSELRGTPACIGRTSGVVKIIISAEDMKKMNKGDILVSPATNPNLMLAIKKAAAIVTDEGGITCHAAIVSRELGIPCIIGTKIATKVLKDGDFVEVDANKGIVRILKK